MHDGPRLQMLDGWRAMSILFVLAAHLFPLGPKSWGLNDAVGIVGMALFFTLSGFLITRFLMSGAPISEFLIRRIFRILPLAWVAMLVALPMVDADFAAYPAHFLFYANFPPQHLTSATSHLWSLCVEMQFYFGIAMLVRVFGLRGLYLLPFICLAVTFHRAVAGAYSDIVTWRRVDEILAGAMLAMLFEGRFGPAPRAGLRRLNVYALLVLLLVCSLPAASFMNYFRPYVAALLVGASLIAAPPKMARVLQSKFMSYIAAISYCLYVSHHILASTWLGSGDRLEKYAKRPLLLAATFLTSHMSTFQFEQRCIEAGKRISMFFTRRKSAMKP